MPGRESSPVACPHVTLGLLGIVASCVLGGHVVAAAQESKLPGALKDLPIRGQEANPPVSCRKTVDSDLERRVNQALDNIWIKGKSWDAVRTLEAALERDPYLQLASMALGTWYWALEPPKALAILNASIQLCPDTAQLYFNRANVHSTLGDPRAALSDLERSHKMGKDNASLHFNMGNAFAKLKQFEKAITAYDEALRRNPSHPGALRNSVVANVDAGNHAAALAGIDRILLAVQSGELREWALSTRRKIERGR